MATRLGNSAAMPSRLICWAQSAMTNSRSRSARPTKNGAGAVRGFAPSFLQGNLRLAITARCFVTIESPDERKRGSALFCRRAFDCLCADGERARLPDHENHQELDLDAAIRLHRR